MGIILSTDSDLALVGANVCTEGGPDTVDQNCCPPLVPSGDALGGLITVRKPEGTTVETGVERKERPLLDSEALNDLELDKAYDKFAKAQDRIIRNSGQGATDGGLEITKHCLAPLIEVMQQAIEAPGKHDRALIAVIRELPVATIAFCTLQSLLRCVSQRETLRTTAEALGQALANECWGAKLTVDQPKLAEKITRLVKQRHARASSRMKAAHRIAEAGGYRQRMWSREASIAAGGWCLDLAMQGLPLVFETIRVTEEETLVGLTPIADDWAQDAITRCMKQNPVYLPMVEQPEPWTGFRKGGPKHAGSLASVVRTRHKQTEAAVRSAIRSGQMQPALDGLNALQSVAWTINEPILEVLRWAARTKQPIKGMPKWRNVPLPVRPATWEALDKADQKLWYDRERMTKVRNLGFGGDRLLFNGDMETAELMAAHERFWTPMNLDWRGRVYGIPHFNFHRDDRVRALFLFADGEPIGTEGLRWLKMHVANCGDFNKISKRPIEERIAWTDQNLNCIVRMTQNPMRLDEAHLDWRKADKPFLFLASCMELSAALRAGPTYVTRLPVSFDGSCSGLQHLCAMTRAPEGSLVNLTPNALPADVYQTVADRTLLRLQADARSSSEHAAVAATWLAHGVDRKVVKRNVMTFAYASKKFGMSQQHVVDLMKPLRYDVLDGKMAQHPFGADEMGQKAAAGYLAGHVYETIKSVVELPAAAMGYLQKIARALAHEGKPVQWMTPVGLPWINRYHDLVMTEVALWLADRGVKIRHRMQVAVGFEPAIAKDRAANGVAPNFVHALDAAHLLLVARAASRLGMTQLATVHDSFGCLASRAGEFNRIIREQFVEMYTTHDVLAEVLAQATHDLTPANSHRLPDVLQYGSLELKEVLNAQYAFA